MSVAALSEAVVSASRTTTVEACYLAHRERVYHWCLRYAGGRTDWAEDLAHDVFVRMAENFARLDDPDEIGRWLYRVTANLAISRLRRERLAFDRLLKFFLGESMEEAKPADQMLEHQQAAAEALAALRQLPTRERVVISMRILDGLSQREIAKALDYSEGYVSKLLKRGMARLQDAGGWEES